jgi:hypothetical protein
MGSNHRLFVFICLTLAVTGCSRGPKRYVVSGTITYQGRPVPAGRILFEPDVEKGNRGPGGVAEIYDGSYCTLDDMGVVGGPHIARFSLGDGVNPSVLFRFGKPVPLPPDCMVTLDVPHEDTSYDITVPAVATTSKVQR